jgi:hypothetical protein
MNRAVIDWAAFVEQSAIALELPIPSEYQTSVVENFERIAAIAHLVTEFTLPDELEPAPIFQPEQPTT